MLDAIENLGKLVFLASVGDEARSKQGEKKQRSGAMTGHGRPRKIPLFVIIFFGLRACNH